MAVQDATPDIRPRAGHDLLTGIENVLPRLDGPAPPDLADDLMTALVRCAACGDISRVREQADAVRRATALLRTGEPEKAGPVLTQARAALRTFAPLR
ncbi:MAG: hypothetical protein GEV28_29615 [Actinophytocola sp.]|uniref:hypothetical protein n=1 Tax=Actinophytocola sp. TaxID=1872138 RepID=UPI00132BB381|nr:hypothetical protein [Actinophytocola sp.]MPZ84329.1 hypothetical protein [Actinophytocola sp.]